MVHLKNVEQRRKRVNARAAAEPVNFFKLTGSRPNERSSEFRRPNRAPEKNPKRQMMAAITYDTAVGMKNTDRKNA